MTHDSLRTSSLHRLMDGLQTGDAAAQDELIRRVGGRLERLAKKMLGSFQSVRAWEETSDILQGALMRLLRALREVRPNDTRAFFALAATQLRRELIDLSRHYRGAFGLARNVVLGGPESERSGANPAFDVPGDDERLERWQAFHRAVEELPVELREVFSLTFYHGWTQQQIAGLLNVTDRTVRRHWQTACLRLNDQLQGELPID